ncbi:hypothetical protein [Methylobacterium sp. A54F]
MQLLAVVLVCAAAISPAECSRVTALDVATRPVAMPMECAMTGQVIAAETLDLHSDDGRYLVTRCERRKG